MFIKFFSRDIFYSRNTTRGPGVVGTSWRMGEEGEREFTFLCWDLYYRVAGRFKHIFQTQTWEPSCVWKSKLSLWRSKNPVLIFLNKAKNIPMVLKNFPIKFEIIVMQLGFPANETFREKMRNFCSHFAIFFEKFRISLRKWVKEKNVKMWNAKISRKIKSRENHKCCSCNN